VNKIIKTPPVKARDIPRNDLWKQDHTVKPTRTGPSPSRTIKQPPLPKKAR